MSNETHQFKEELIQELTLIKPNTASITTTNSNCFITKCVNEWIDEAKRRPIPNMLFSELWFENELCILFSDTNLGKSILSLQIANSISKGVCIYGFKLETEPQKVLYFDFELSDKQLEKRYSNNYSDHYIFNENLLRAEINPEQETPSNFKSFEEFLCCSIEQAIIKDGIKILVIDNITYLNNDTEKAKDALPLMKLLNGLKKKYLLSILVLAHSPKRDASKPITKNDLSGSKMLMNFCDSCFAIGESHQESGLRYLKQIKQRNTEHMYDTQNVIISKIENLSNFLQFSFVGFENELDHLKQFSPKDTDDRLQEIVAMKNKKMPNTEIAKALGVSEGTIRKALKDNN
ncbi:AAA domain-containing protein [Flavobacterium gillisiae]|uniref:AAA domain-containing protein n=1 Tax=Flavobacterium gillisiae TaxID=150146 RepID=A0A1H4GDJ9_9FLAO|nr:AAA family ATPase [Flavobacterium gillisiae]SEB06988.1 AAA domain-containing protein [Flavobacterium gillisiae]